jgi:hypothetical protein
MRWSNLTMPGRVLLLTLLAFMAALGLFAQDGKAPAKEYHASEIQSLKIQLAQKDALLAKANLEQAQRTFQQALTDLNALAQNIKKENGWPEEVQFDPNTTQFSTPPAKTSTPTGKKP